LTCRLIQSVARYGATGATAARFGGGPDAPQLSQDWRRRCGAPLSFCCKRRFPCAMLWRFFWSWTVRRCAGAVPNAGGDHVAIPEPTRFAQQRPARQANRICRSREVQPNGVWLWATLDNLRISALTAVECAESMGATRPTGKKSNEIGALARTSPAAPAWHPVAVPHCGHVVQLPESVRLSRYLPSKMRRPPIASSRC